VPQSLHIFADEAITTSGCSTTSSFGRKEIVKLLLDKGADKNASDKQGFTATDFSRKMNKKSILEILGYDETMPKNTSFVR
jgi:ankyrin repeat protein